VLKVLLAAQNNAAESHWCAPTRLPVFGQTPQSTLRARKTLCGQNVTSMVTHGELSTANDCMQPAFAGSYKTVAIPFGSRVTGCLSREHPLVKNGSRRDRFVEGIEIRADRDTPCIRMYCITSGYV